MRQRMHRICNAVSVTFFIDDEAEGMDALEFIRGWEGWG